MVLKKKINAHCLHMYMRHHNYYTVLYIIMYMYVKKSLVRYTHTSFRDG